MQVLIQQQLEHVMQHATTTDGALEMYPGAGVANIGIMLFRSSAMIFAQVCNCPPDGMLTPDRSDMIDITPCGPQSFTTLPFVTTSAMPHFLQIVWLEISAHLSPTKMHARWLQQMWLDRVSH